MTRRQTKSELLGIVAKLTQEMGRLVTVEAELAQLRVDLTGERVRRIAAQRGIRPYVQALEGFDGWLRERLALRQELEPILRELGLWEIKLGYDPDKDLQLSAISPLRK